MIVAMITKISGKFFMMTMFAALFADKRFACRFSDAPQRVYSMPTFAPELAKHDPFGHARAMIGVQATLLAPVQVLPHGHSSKTRRHDPRWPAK